jgi:uncharacterized protein (TIGR02996 family)
MNSEADFIAAIEASPDDELLLGAFGDWLEERGDPRAAWVRLPAVRPWMGPSFENPIPKLMDALKRKHKVIDVRRAAGTIGAVMVPALVELLRHSDAGVRQQAILCLRKMKKAAAEAVPALVESLEDTEASVREQAAKAIKDCGAKKVADAACIRASLADEHWSVRRQAAEILSRMGAKSEALERLVEQLSDPDPAVRKAATEGLGILKSRAAIVPLCRALADDSGAVREAAAGFLVDLVARDMAEAVEPLRGALTDADPWVRRRAAEALGKIGPVAIAAVPELLPLTHDKGAFTSEWAVEALGNIAAGDEGVLAALERLIAEAPERVAVAAAVSLAKWPSLPERIGELMLGLSARMATEDGRFSQSLHVLGKLERVTPAVLELLRRVVREDTRHYYHEGGPYLALMQLGPQAVSAIPELADAVRRGSQQAAEALGCMGEAGVAQLIELLDDPGEHVAYYAAHGLWRAGEGALPALPRLRAFFARDNHPYKDMHLLREVCRTIGWMGTGAADAIPDLLTQLDTNWGDGAREALRNTRLCPALIPHLPTLVSILRDPQRFYTHPAIAQLLLFMTLHTKEVVEPLREALRAAAPIPGDKHHDRIRCSRQTREIAARALSIAFLREVASAALPELLPLLRDPFEEVRCRAAEVLGEIGAAEAVPGLRAALRDNDGKVRALAAVALGKIGESSVAGDLASSLKDTSARVRRESAKALGKLAPDREPILSALRQAENDPDKGVRREATAALKRIQGQPTG